MRKQYYLLLAFAGIISLFNSCNDKSKKGIDLALGLAKEDPAKMSRIPIADVPFGGTELPASFCMSDKMPEPGSQGGEQSAWPGNSLCHERLPVKCAVR